MARHRKGKVRKWNPTEEAQAVVSGRVRADAGRLFRLIHEVNPTGMDLPSAEQEKLYALKSGLQSLLVRHFSDDLDVERAPRGEGVVSLRHRHLPVDACHTIVEALDDDARSWVLHRLDMIDTGEETYKGESNPVRDRIAAKGSSSAPAATSQSLSQRDSSVQLSTDELLRLGRGAIEAYDYDEARGYLSMALERSGGEFHCALPLLELLVDHLAADQEALTLEEELPAKVLRRPEIRILLALAAVRCGEKEKAEKWIFGIEGARAAEVFIPLATFSLRAEEVQEAERLLAHARRHNPAHPELDSLSREIDRLRASKRKPLEEELTRVYERGDMEEAEGLANGLIEKWPKSRVARSILKEIRARRRKDEAQARRAEGDAAFGAGEFARAAVLLKEARALGERGDDLVESIRKAEEALHRDRSEKRLKGVFEMLRDEEIMEGLHAYMGLEAEERVSIRGRIDLPELLWLEQLGTSANRARDKATVEAILALREAVAGEVKEPEKVLSLLDPHKYLLVRIPIGRKLIEEARGRAIEQKRIASERSVDEAHRAFTKGEIESARLILEGLDVRVLPEEAQRRVDSLLEEVGRREEMERKAHRIESLIETGKLIEARNEAAALAGLVEGPEKEEWTARSEKLAEDVMKAWRIRICPIEGRDTDPVCTTLLAEIPFACRRAVWLDPARREIMIVRAHGPWIFIWVFGIESPHARSLVALRPPEPMADLVAEVVDGLLWIIDCKGLTLALSHGRWEVVWWRSLEELLGEDLIVEEAMVLPGSRYLWVEYRHKGASPGETFTVVVDIERWRVHRKIGHSGIIEPLFGSGEAKVAMLETREGGDKFYSERGSIVDGMETPHESSTHWMVVHPQGKGLLALCPSFVEGEWETEEEWVLESSAMDLLVLDTDRDAGHAMTIEELHEDWMFGMATSLDKDLAFLLFCAPDINFEIQALGAGKSGIERLYRVGMPDDTVLVQDAGSRCVAALVPTQEGIAISELGPEPPLLPMLEPVDRSRLPAVDPPFMCWLYHGKAADLSIRIRSVVSTYSPSQLDDWLERSFRDFKDRPKILCDIIDELRLNGHSHRADAFARTVRERHPEDPLVALMAADLAADQRRWSEVREILDRVDPGSLDDDSTCHLFHLLGLAHLHLNNPDAAREAFTRGASFADDPCGLETCLELVSPLPEPLDPDDWGPGQPRTRQILGAIRTADACLDRGDFEGARLAVDRPSILKAREVQSLARLAEACLHGEPADEADRMRRILSLARYCEAHVPNRSFTYRNLPIPGVSWSDERLTEIHRRVLRRLDELTAGEG